eukprot:320007-Prorocentrum_minimum.AAC.3
MPSRQGELDRTAIGRTIFQELWTISTISSTDISAALLSDILDNDDYEKEERNLSCHALVLSRARQVSEKFSEKKNANPWSLVGKTVITVPLVFGTTKSAQDRRNMRKQGKTDT